MQQDGIEQLKTETRKQTGQQFGFLYLHGEQRGLWAVECRAVGCELQFSVKGNSDVYVPLTHTAGLKKLKLHKMLHTASDWERRLGRTSSV